MLVIIIQRIIGCVPQYAHDLSLILRLSLIRVHNLVMTFDPTSEMWRVKCHNYTESLGMWLHDLCIRDYGIIMFLCKYTHWQGYCFVIFPVQHM